MSTPPIIFTHCGKLGDFFFSMPVASAYYKLYHRKIHWILPSCFEPFHYIENLLRFQEMTADFHLCDFPVRDYACGGQPYTFDPATYGYIGDYINLGFPTYPTTFATKFYADSAGLTWDEDFVLEVGEPIISDRIIQSNHYEMNGRLQKNFEVLPIPMDLLEMGRVLKGAKERHNWISGIAALLHMARIPFDVYYNEHNDIEKFHTPNLFGGPLTTYHLC